MRQRWIDSLYAWSTDSFIDYRKYIKESLIAICLALTVRSLFVTFYKIPSGSMIPTFKVGDVILADRYQFGWKLPFTSHMDGYRVGLSTKPKRGDIVIFQSPPEKEFWNLRVQIKNDLAIPFLLEINNASAHIKRPIDRLPDGTTNYVFIHNPLQSKGPYFIPTMEDFYGNHFAHITIHPTIYRRYGEKLQLQKDHLTIVGRKKIRLYTGYTEEDSWHLFSLFQIPITGLSIVSEVCLRTPLLLVPRLILFSGVRPFHTILQKPDSSFDKKSFVTWQEFLIDFFTFSVYPNPWIDARKDFVKRVVATEGDTVEIYNSRLRINGVDRPLLSPISDENSEIAIFETPVVKQNGSFVKKYKVRKKNPPNSIESLIPFDKEIWPYDPTLQSPFVKDMNIGPIIVPPGHLFVMGDNMEASLDSRCWGFVPFRVLKGYPRIKIWPKIEKIY